MMENGLSVADAMALGNNDSFGNSSWFWIVVLFLFGGFGGYGWGNRNEQYATSADVQRSENSIITNDRFNSLSSQQSENAKENAILIKDSQYTNLQNINSLTSAMNQGFTNIGSQLCCGFNGVDKEIMNSTYSTTQAINQGVNGLSSEMCCGFNNVTRGIDSIKYENAQNTCAITNAIHQEGELTRGLIQANTIQDLRDRLEEKDRLYQAANYTLANATQTRTILDSMGRWVSNPPVPYPAYAPIYGTTYATTVA